jgi:hypothetical protein
MRRAVDVVTVALSPTMGARMDADAYADRPAAAGDP